MLHACDGSLHLVLAADAVEAAIDAVDSDVDAAKASASRAEEELQIATERIATASAVDGYAELGDALSQVQMTLRFAVNQVWASLNESDLDFEAADRAVSGARQRLVAIGQDPSLGMPELCAAA